MLNLLKHLYNQTVSFLQYIGPRGRVELILLMMVTAIFATLIFWLF